MNRWWGYVVRVAGTDEQKAIARQSGIGTTVISRWFQEKNQPSAPLAVQFARAYNRPAVEALVEAGYLSESDASEVIEVHRGIEALGDDVLLSEVRKRMRVAAHAVSSSAPPAEVTPPAAAHAAPSSSPAAPPAPGLRVVDGEKDALDEAASGEDDAPPAEALADAARPTPADHLKGRAIDGTAPDGGA